MLEWIVTSDQSGSKLLSFLAHQFEGKYSTRFLKTLIEHNNCEINGRIERFASTRLGQGDHVTLRLEQQIIIRPLPDGKRKEFFTKMMLF